MCWHPKHVFLENLAWILTPKAIKVGAQNPFQLSLKKIEITGCLLFLLHEKGTFC